jgi:hypothetical protein
MRFSAPLTGPMALLLGLAGCSDSTTTTTEVEHQTLVEVSPGEFLGSVPCLDAAGAMRRYVATLWDVTGTSADTGEGGAGGVDGSAGATFAEPFALPSSGPVPCTESVAFAFVVTGHRYVASVDGYDRDDLVPLETSVPILLDPETGDRVEPRWTTRCGDEDPATSYGEISRIVRGCTPLVDRRPGGATAVEVRLDTLLGELSCGDEPGSIARFEVRGPDGVTEAACDEAVSIEPPAGASTLVLPVLAYESAAETPSVGTVCTARVVSGVVTPASCSPLESTGALVVQPNEALQTLGLDCNTPFADLTAEVVGDETATSKELDRTSCARSLEFASLPHGEATVRFSLRETTDAEPRTALCTAAVEPGQVATATCSSEP